MSCTLKIVIRRWFFFAAFCLLVKVVRKVKFHMKNSFFIRKWTRLNIRENATSRQSCYNWARDVSLESKSVNSKNSRMFFFTGMRKEVNINSSSSLLSQTRFSFTLLAFYGSSNTKTPKNSLFIHVWKNFFHIAPGFNRNVQFSTNECRFMTFYSVAAIRYLN